MALKEIYGTIGISKTWRASKTGFLFFLLLQMSLLSKVWTQTATSTSTSGATDSTSSTSESTGSSSSSMSTTLVTAATTTNSMTGSTSASLTSPSSTPASSVSGSTVSSLVYTNMTSMVAVNGSSSTGNDSMISCPAFTCSSDCYSQFMNATMKPCPTKTSFCEVTKQDTSYSVGCSASCGLSCGNTTLSNCTVTCCNSSSCLNNTLSALSSSLTTAATTKLSATTTTIKASTTPPNNGKLCQNIMCSGALCYKTSGSQMLCPIGQDYCMLQKTMSGTVENWQGGCSGDCRAMAACSTSVTTACYLECCNATTLKICLKLTGELNMPSSASRGPHCPMLLLASTLLLWVLRVFN